MNKVCLLVFIGILLVEGTPSLNDVIGSNDQRRLRDILRSTRITDLETAYYVAGGLTILGGDNSDVVKGVCSYVKSAKVEVPVDYFYATSVVTAIGKKSCDRSFSDKDLAGLLSNTQRNLTELYWLATSLANIGAAIPKSVTVDELVSMMDREGSLTSSGHAFSIGALLDEPNVSGLTDLFEDVVAQADEANGVLYFDGGLPVTTAVLNGIFQLADKANTSPAISINQATMFGNYIVNAKYTAVVKEVFCMLKSAQLLSRNKFVVPAGLIRSDFKSISAKDNTIQFIFTNILNGGIDRSSVILKSIQDPSGETDTRNKPLTANSDGISYSYSMSEYTETPGQYKLSLSTENKGESPVAELSDVNFEVTVGLSVGVTSAELAIIEKEQNVAVKMLSLDYPNSVSEIPVADHHSKVKMTFSLINEANKNKITLHQTFVRLVSSDNNEIFFVAMPNSDKTYTFELDIAKVAKESFDSKSGTYDMMLIVGGAIVQNPFSWSIGKITLKFSGTSQETTNEEQLYRYKPRPEIQHMFRPPEKLPPFVISAAFSGLIIMMLLVLIILWLILGVNVSNLFLSGVWALIFHGGLVAIFLLYYCFWTYMNMFQTLKWLILIGGVTFLAGNKMLKVIAKNKGT